MKTLAAVRPKALKRLLILALTFLVLFLVLWMISGKAFRSAPRIELHFVSFNRDTNGLLTALLQITNSGKKNLWLFPQVRVSFETLPNMEGTIPLKGAR